jgi:hypothetical protein
MAVLWRGTGRELPPVCPLRRRHVTRQRRWFAAGVALASLMLLAACTGDKPSDPTPTTATTRPSPPPDPAREAPPVQNPLDAVAFEGEPCRSLTDAQQKLFGFDSAKIDHGLEGERCLFLKAKTKQATSVTFASKMTDGLSGRYSEHASGTWNYWEPTVIDGYPAVAFSTILSGQPGPDGCNLGVGIKDSLYFWVTVDAHDGGNGCAEARDVATAVLSTVKAAR